MGVTSFFSALIGRKKTPQDTGAAGTLSSEKKSKGRSIFDEIVTDISAFITLDTPITPTSATGLGGDPDRLTRREVDAITHASEVVAQNYSKYPVFALDKDEEKHSDADSYAKFKALTEGPRYMPPVKPNTVAGC